MLTKRQVSSRLSKFKADNTGHYASELAKHRGDLETIGDFLARLDPQRGYSFQQRKTLKDFARQKLQASSEQFRADLFAVFFPGLVEIAEETWQTISTLPYRRPHEQGHLSNAWQL